MAAAHTANDAEGFYLNATVKQLWGALDEAEKLAEKAVAANPKEARYHYRLSAAARNGAILGGLDGYRCQWVSGPSAGTR
jgi:hypothetical protein